MQPLALALFALHGLARLMGSPVFFAELQAANVAGQPEWVELAHIGSGVADLSGWMLGDAGSRHALPAGTRLLPGGRLVLSPHCDTLRKAWNLPAMPCAEPKGWLRLSQTADAICLYDSAGVLQDSAAWDAGWGGWPAGKSRERRRFDLPSTLRANWVTSPDALGATPGWSAAPGAGWSAPGDSVTVRLALEHRLFVPGDARRTTVLGMRIVAPEGSRLQLDVYDLDRRRVRRVHDGAVPSEGRLVWDGRDGGGRICHIGPYLVVLEAVLPDGRRLLQREWTVLGRSL